LRINSTALSSTSLSVDSANLVSMSTISILTLSEFRKLNRIGRIRVIIGLVDRVYFQAGPVTHPTMDLRIPDLTGRTRCNMSLLKEISVPFALGAVKLSRVGVIN